ncbi:MAG: alpha-1,3-galactosidase B [Mucinivorans sp.]
MRKFIVILCCLMLGLGTSYGAKPIIYQGARFGIVPNTGDNMSPLMQEALKFIKSQTPKGRSSVLALKKGRYDFMAQGAAIREYYISNHDQTNPKTVGIAIEDMVDFTLDGGGSDLYFNGRMLPIALLRSTNCTIKNLSVDNPNPQIMQIQIESNDTVKGIITYRIAPWVKYRIEKGTVVAYGENWAHTQGSGIAFELNTKHMVYRTSDIGVATSGVQEIEPRLMKVAWKNDKLIPGTVVACRTWMRPTPGVFMSHDKDTHLENIQVHYAEGMGLLAQMSENIWLNGFSVALRDKNDPRYFTTQADATHFSGCKGMLSSVGGLYENMMDDAINVHGTYLKVIERLSPTKVIARYMHDQAWGFEWGRVGDSVQIVRSETMELLDGINTITAIKPHDKDKIEGAREYEIEFAQPLEPCVGPEQGFGIENLEWTPEVIFADNTIRNNRARGTLFSTPRKTVIQGNLFDHTSGTAILLCGDCNGWYETGACRDVVIRKNKFVNALTNMFQFTNAIISIYPEIPNLKGQTKYFHGGNGGGVVIEDNVFETFDSPILYAKSIDGLTFRNNKITQSKEYAPFHWNNHRFLLERTKNVTIENNDFEGGYDDTKDILSK